ncbi:sulfite exporter TauE/SafE family protein [Agromyces sp. SYSU K20354]|uniref:sulfite exporter TauE/SafE family protein n=1 Tax=Agromyces cavernae TaxID=2898659 RepID=UPI001E3DA2F2|nr:sulfite exporter TauE/SafE family protein [Agromyces cavernae]MCD2441497.1 sulfite exporter TauE/SafE family protein [Agromyces cavernae]
MTSPAPLTPAPSRASWVRLALIGAAGGLLSGAFGVGGGILMVPLLIVFADMDQRRASATSLAAIVPTAVVGAITYSVNGEVDVIAALFVAAGGIVGGWLGAKLLGRIPLTWLRWMFIGLLVIVAARMLFLVPERVAGLVELDALTIVGMVVLGVVIGIAAGLFGIGGGIIMVPAFIILLGMSDLVAKGTSLAVMIPTAVSGTVTNARSGIVDLRAGIIAGAAATVASFGGVAIAHVLSPEWSTWLFSALIVIATVQLAVRAVRAQRRERNERGR